MWLPRPDSVKVQVWLALRHCPGRTPGRSEVLPPLAADRNFQLCNITHWAWSIKYVENFNHTYETLCSVKKKFQWKISNVGHNCHVVWSVNHYVVGFNARNLIACYNPECEWFTFIPEKISDRDPERCKQCVSPQSALRRTSVSAVFYVRFLNKI
jgi:hypothetical protein